MGDPPALVETARLSRRTLLFAGMGLAATACARRAAPARAVPVPRGRSTPPATSSGPLPVLLGMTPPGPLSFTNGQVVAALSALDSRFRWWTPNECRVPSLTAAKGSSAVDKTAGRAPAWGIGHAPPYYDPPVFAPLTSALSLENFNRSTLIPGALEAFTVRSEPYGLPVGISAIGIRCNLQAFKEADLALPSPGWTLNDFLETCAAFDAAIQAGRVTSAVAALPPLVGTSSWPGTSWIGGLFDPTVWGAFVLGYGASIVDADGRFDLTTPGAARGLQELVALARAYGAPQEYIPKSSAAMTALQSSTAMAFQALLRQGTTTTGHQWVPFPSLPVRAVAPATVWGVWPLPVTACKTQPPASARTTPLPALQAVTVYARWMYQLASTNTAITGMLAPVLADANAQDAYWIAQSGGTSSPLVDWRNYAVVEAGFPPTGNASLSQGGRSNADWLVYQALTQAILDGTPLPRLLATTTEQLNAAATVAAPPVN